MDIITQMHHTIFYTSFQHLFQIYSEICFCPIVFQQNIYLISGGRFSICERDDWTKRWTSTAWYHQVCRQFENKDQFTSKRFMEYGKQLISIKDLLQLLLSFENGAYAWQKNIDPQHCHYSPLCPFCRLPYAMMVI